LFILVIILICNRCSFLLMSNFVPRLSCFRRALYLLCLLCSAIAQADNSWQKESSRHLEQLLKSNPDQLQELKDSAVLEFYRERKYKLLWSNQKGRLDRASDLLHVIIQAKNEGLEPSDYYLEEFSKYWDSTELSESVQLDLLLSAALYRYSNEVYSGRLDANYLDPDWHIKNESLDISRLFADVAKKSSIGNLLKELPPQHDGYQSLKQHLYQFRELAQQGGWQNLGWGPVLERSVQHEQVVLLRRRLKVTGDLAVDPFPDMDIFDRRLEEAVRRYQQRHGLEVDGKVGPQTRRSLDITVSERIRQRSHQHGTLALAAAQAGETIRDGQYDRLRALHHRERFNGAVHAGDYRSFPPLYTHLFWPDQLHGIQSLLDNSQETGAGGYYSAPAA